MGVWEKLKEEKKPEEKKTEEPKAEEKKAEEPKEQPPPKAEGNPAPPPEIVLRVYMHCEGCARKVRRCLKGFPGVEDVQTDCKTHKVVVKGEKADPMAVLERVQKKSHRQVDLLSPIPEPPAEDPKKPEEKEVEKPPQKKEEPQVITVVLQVHMHCEACAQEIRRRILKMSGVEEVEPDLKSSQVKVNGIFDPPKLVEYVHKRTGKHATIVEQEEKGKEEKKADGSDDKAAAGDAGEEKKDGGGEATAASPAEEKAAVVEEVANLKKHEFFYNYPQNYHIVPYPQRYEMQPYPQYPPQMFSDENPNACSVM